MVCRWCSGGCVYRLGWRASSTHTRRACRHHPEPRAPRPCHPVSCAIALSVLEIIEEENLQENAKTVGDYLKSLFGGLLKKYSCIGDVRGSGLFLGVEMVKDKSFEPDTRLANHIKNELRNRLILINTDGPHDNVLKIKPPLRFSKEDAFKTEEQIENILKTHYNIDTV